MGKSAFLYTFIVTREEFLKKLKRIHPAMTRPLNASRLATSGKFKRRMPPLRMHKRLLVLLAIVVVMLLYYQSSKVVLPPLVELPPPLVTWERPKNHSSKLVVTLTTFPARFSSLLQVMDSFIFEQTRQPDLVYVWVPLRLERLNIGNSEEMQVRTQRAIEIMLNRYGGYADPILYGKSATFKSGPLRILSCVDYGPMTKLVPTLMEETDPNSILVTLDDDMVYAKRTLELLETSTKAKRGRLSAFFCEVAPDQYENRIFQSYGGECPGWINGCAGVAYLRSFFQLPAEVPTPGSSVPEKSSAILLEKQLQSAGVYQLGRHLTEVERITIFSDLVYHVRDKSVPPGCRIHDDVWLSGVLYMRSIYAYIVDGAEKEPSMVRHIKQPTGYSIGNAVHGYWKSNKEQWDCVLYFKKFQRPV